MHLLFPFIVGLTIGIGIMLGIVDYRRKVDDSALYLYITILNTVVMSVLTYLIYRVNNKTASINEDMVEINKRVADTNDKIVDVSMNDSKVNEKIAEITAFQIFTLEKRLQSRIISKSRKFKEKANTVKYMTYPFLPVTNKRILIIEAFNENEIINKHGLSFTFPIDINNLPDLPIGANYQFELGIFDDQDMEKVELIENIFNSAMPSSIKARWKLQDYKEALEFLNSINTDDDFYQFAFTRENLVESLERVNEIFEREIQGLDFKKGILGLNLNRHTSAQIYLNIVQVLENLEIVENAALEEYKKLKNY